MVDNWRECNQGIRQYTWVKAAEGRISAARLDRIYTSRRLSNRVTNASIWPNGFSDHHLVTIDVNLDTVPNTSSFWHLNVKLLQDAKFSESFGFFWERWRGSKERLENRRQWWEVGKTHIRVFCQRYAASISGRVKAAVRKLEQEIGEIERPLLLCNDPGLQVVLHLKRVELGSFLQDQVKGALIRACVTNIRDMDGPTAFFFNLERKKGERKQMLHLRLPSGGITKDPAEVRRRTRAFYADLYGAGDRDPESAQELLQDLPKLRADQREALEVELSLQELTVAVQQMSVGKSPGLDGLPAEFYRHLCFGS